jgi:hypothetical protein
MKIIESATCESSARLNLGRQSLCGFNFSMGSIAADFRGGGKLAVRKTLT